MIALEGERCCATPRRTRGLMRLMSVIADDRPAMRAVDHACSCCGDALLCSGRSAALRQFETRYLGHLLDASRAFSAAAALRRETDAATLRLPQPGHLDDLGLSARIWNAMVLDPATTDRNVALSHLGLAPGEHRTIDVPGPLKAVRLDEYAVMHLEEKRERWDLEHVGFLPLVESTLRHPFEIWYGAGAKKGEGEQRNYRFLSLYQLDAVNITHVVFYNPRRKKVVSSHRLAGWSQTMQRRSGIPIYAAYAPE